MEQLAALQAIIREESEQLICQTHPEVCALRDANYARLEELVLDRLLGNEEETISVQSALAELETELGHVQIRIQLLKVRTISNDSKVHYEHICWTILCPTS